MTTKDVKHGRTFMTGNSRNHPTQVWPFLVAQLLRTLEHLSSKVHNFQTCSRMFCFIATVLSIEHIAGFNDYAADTRSRNNT